MEEDRVRKYIATLLERVHVLRQSRIEDTAEVNDEASDERDEQSYAVRILAWLRDRL